MINRAVDLRVGCIIVNFQHLKIVVLPTKEQKNHIYEIPFV